MKVLFLGNSHTFFNDMPELFARFVEKTTGNKPDVTMLAYSGRTLEWHRKEYFSLRFNLMYGGYDYVILQQAAHPYPDIDETLKTGADIIDLCHRCGVKPIVYMTWAEKRFPENQQKMIDTCEKMAKDNNALLAPIGKIWQKIQNERPDIDLYYKDGEHAGPYGDFLIAATFCKVICGDVSDETIGFGFNFAFGLTQPLDMNRPLMQEDKALVEVELDKEQTAYILNAVKNI
ncbi:MAG: hypothetical protein IJM96_00385 [Clostridia bacterium]|nr:hypothetical protein [Clostridia bacterium]